MGTAGGDDNANSSGAQISGLTVFGTLDEEEVKPYVRPVGGGKGGNPRDTGSGPQIAAIVFNGRPYWNNSAEVVESESMAIRNAAKFFIETIKESKSVKKDDKKQQQGKKDGKKKNEEK